MAKIGMERSNFLRVYVSRSVYREERYHNKGGERERDVADFFWFLKQNFQVTRLMTYLS